MTLVPALEQVWHQALDRLGGRAPDHPVIHLYRPWLWKRRAHELAETIDRMRGLLDMSRSFAFVDDEADLLKAIATAACRCLGYRVAVVMVCDVDGLYRCRASAGCALDLEDRVLRLAVPADVVATLRAAATPMGGILYVPPDHPVWQQSHVTEHVIETTPTVPSGEWQPRSLLFLPLTDIQGADLGFLNLDDPVHGDLPKHSQVAIFEAFAYHAAVALQVVRGRAADRQRRRQMEELLHASASIRGSLRLDDVLQQIACAITSAGGFGRVAIYLRNAVDDRLHVRAAAGLSPEDDLRLRTSPVPMASFTHLMQPEMRQSRSYLYDHRCHAVPQATLDYLSVPPDPPGWADGQWHPFDSLTIPLEDRQGRCIGIISVDEPYDRAFPELATIQALELFADQCAIAVEHARLYEEVQQLALTDALTGLYNRRAFYDALRRELARVQREDSPCSLLFCDLDHFKRINDTYGHATGDQILRAVATMLRQRLRHSDLVARYGGEEFVALLPHTTCDQACAIAEDLRGQVAALATPALPAGVALSVSIGVVSASTATVSAEALIAEADRCLYAAKAGGRNRVYGA